MDALPLTARNTNISSPHTSTISAAKKHLSENITRSVVSGFADKLLGDPAEERSKRMEACSRTPTSGSFLAHSVAHATAHSQTLGPVNFFPNTRNQQENNHSHMIGMRQGSLPIHASAATCNNILASSVSANQQATTSASGPLKSRTMPEEAQGASAKGAQRSANRGLFSPTSTRDIKLSVQTPKVTQFSPMVRERPSTNPAPAAPLEPKRFSQFFDEKNQGNLRYNVESFYLNSFVIELGDSPLYLGCGVYFLKDIVQNLFNSALRVKCENLLMDIISNLKLYKYQLTSARQGLLVALLEDIHEQVRQLWKREQLLEFQRSEILCKKLISDLRRSPPLREALGNLIQEIAIEFLLNLSDRAKIMIVQSRSELQEILLLMRNFESENQKQTRSAQRLFGTINALLCCSLTLNIEYHRFEESGYKTEVYTANNKIARNFDDVGISKAIGNISFLRFNGEEKVYMLVQPSDYESIFKLDSFEPQISFTPLNSGVSNPPAGLATPGNPSPFQLGTSSANQNSSKPVNAKMDRTPEQGESSSTQAVMKEINRIYKKTPVSNQREIEDDPRPNSLKADLEKKGMSRIKEVKQKRINEQSSNFTENMKVQIRGREAERSVDRFKLRSATKEEARPSSKSFLNQLSQIAPIRAPEVNFNWERVTSSVGALLREMNGNSSILEGLAFEEVTEILAPNYFAYINENQPVYYFVQQPATLVQVSTTAAQAALITNSQHLYCGGQSLKVPGANDAPSTKKESFLEATVNPSYNNLLTDRIRLL